MPGYGSDRISGFDNDTADQIKYLEGLIKKYGETSEKAINLRKQIEDLKNKELDEILEKHSRNLKTSTGRFLKEFKESLKEANGNISVIANIVLNSIDSLGNSLKNALDKSISDYVSSIEKLSYSLNGNLRNYSDITSNLNKVLGGQNLVSQERSFRNLSDIINKGIVNNPEQKAFLQSLSQDLGMQFNVSNDTMRQLIRIQSDDSTANRMAIEYSLNEFLVQNYKTGEYIRQGFADVSRALLMSQSTMSSAMAASYEATIQTWMGTLYSNGVSQSTISQLAAAIDAVGSGNINGLGNPGASNLVLMGAARAGLDYGELLNRGYQGNDVNRLMQGITSYIGEIGSNSSNVVMSQLGNIFGLNIADIMAIRNNGVPNVAGMGASANANSMLNSITGLVPGVVRLMNGLDNLRYGWGASIASNENALLGYEFARKIIEPAGNLLGDIGQVFGFGGLPIQILGTIAGNSSLLLTLPQLIGNIGNIWNGNLFKGLINSNRGRGALDIFNLLGAGGDGINNTTVVTSSAGTSGSMAFSRDGGGGLLGNMRSSLNDLGIEETTGDEITIDDHIVSIDNTVQSIFDRLGRILDTMPSNTASGVTYGERSYSGAAFV